MTGTLETKADWAALRLSHPDTWAAIWSPASQADDDPDGLDATLNGQLTAELRNQFSFDAAASLSTTDAVGILQERLEEDGGVARATRAIRSGRRRNLALGPAERNGLGQLELAVAGIDPGALIGGLDPRLASQARGSQFDTPIVQAREFVVGKPDVGESLNDSGCKASIDETGQRVVNVRDSVDFDSSVSLERLASAIHPLNWPLTYEEFFESVDQIGDQVPLTGDSRQVLFEEVVKFRLAGFDWPVKTLLLFDMHGVADESSDEGLPASFYRLVSGGDGQVTADNGHAFIEPHASGGYRMGSMKNIAFRNPLLNTMTELACTVWPTALTTTVENAGGADLHEWKGSFTGVEPEAQESPTLLTERLGVIGANRTAPADEIPEPLLDWNEGYIKSFANLASRATNEQLGYLARLEQRWNGNQEVTLDRVADDSIEWFEINTGLVQAGAELTVKWMEKVAKSTSRGDEVGNLLAKLKATAPGVLESLLDELSRREQAQSQDGSQQADNAPEADESGET